MPKEITPVLEHRDILTKLERMACEICENMAGNSLVFCGMNSRGFYLAEILAGNVAKILPDIHVDLVKVNTPDNTNPVFQPSVDMKDRDVLVIDDVINTGKTLMNVLKFIFESHPKSIHTAFLAKREHRNYPVKADYVGISLATTLQEHVVFDNSDPDKLRVYLN